MKPVKYFQPFLVSDDEKPGQRCRRLNCLLPVSTVVAVQSMGVKSLQLWLILDSGAV